MDLNLKGKIVLISGAAGIKGSIGETMLRVLAKEGAIPAIIDRNDRGYGYVEELKTEGTDAHFVKTDVTQPDQIEKAVKEIAEKYGRIDVVINNVGVNDGVGLDSSYEDFLKSLHLNMISYFLIVKHALPFLKKSKGNILNIGSKVGLTGQGGTSGYAASKGGVIPFENRMTTPEEIANNVAFLISEKSSHTTGQFVFVDGGYVHLDRSLLSTRQKKRSCISV